MKKDYLKKISKIIGFIFINLIVYGIIVGVICGLIVTFLFDTPKISLINSNVIVNNNNVNFEFIYENTGQSPAQNIVYSAKYVILYEDDVKPNIVPVKKQEKFEVGDIVTLPLWIDYLNIEKDIFESSQIILMIKIEYEDSSKLRNFVNKILLNNHYSIYRLGFYDVSKKKKVISVLSVEKRNQYKEIINEWTNE